jgi:hypothetical protein
VDKEEEGKTARKHFQKQFSNFTCVSGYLQNKKDIKQTFLNFRWYQYTYSNSEELFKIKGKIYAHVMVHLTSIYYQNS